MVIVTSLSCKNEVKGRQSKALETWKKAGLDAVSLNFPEEMDEISKSFGGLVQIMAISRACTGTQRRKLVAIADLIETSFIRNHGRCALVLNADILLATGAVAVLSKEKADVTMIPRWQICRYPELKDEEMDPWGYDGVLLAPKMRGFFQNRAFGLGLPWWDYWIPFRALALRQSVRILEEPLAYHERHEEQWNEEDRARLAGEVWREVGVPPWKRLWRKHLGLKKERKFYGYHNHLAGHVRALIREQTKNSAQGLAISAEFPKDHS